MKKNTQNEHYQELKNLQQELHHTLEQSFLQPINELSFIDNHPADIGTETFEQSKDLSLKENIWLQLQEVERALEKMQQGTYGECDLCGKTIAAERLEASPSAIYCLQCQQDVEEGTRHRPLEEELPLYDLAERDGGVLEQVLRYGSSSDDTEHT